MFRKQPKIDIEENPMDQALVKLGWWLVLFHFVLAGVLYATAPETVPTHFNMEGKPTNFGHKANLWVLPVLNAVLYYFLLKLSTQMKPWHYNYPVKVTDANAPKLYAMARRMMVVISLGTVLLLFFLTFQTALQSLYQIGNALQYLLPIYAVTLCLYPFYIAFKMFKLPKE
ncbi:DUF1648 domain-containing protein [Maribacter sp. 2307ULW6-5]|uniref:DUF1648 domain-containing protein n=1 Tax=Maribacter sp. 2307ULW6-5 TaxID=3386275 RepID=UPI0039BC7246